MLLGNLGQGTSGPRNWDAMPTKTGTDVLSRQGFAMRSDAARAKVVGVLFIVATVAAVVGGTLLLPTQEGNFLADAAASEGRVVTGAILEFIQAIAVVGIPVFLFPVLKKVDESLALGFFGARTIEGVFTVAGSVFALLVLSLSKSYEAGAAVEPLGDLLVAGREWTYLCGPTLMFSVSAILLYVLLYRGHLVPAWLSMWGLLGGVLLLASGVIEMFGYDLGGAQAIFSAPIGLNEMVLAVWLIVKGFNFDRIE